MKNFKFKMFFFLSIFCLSVFSYGKVIEESISVSISLALEEYSGNNQLGQKGMPLEDPFVVKVVDKKGNGIQGASIMFSIIHYPFGAMGQSLSVISAITDSNGLASTILTLGNLDGDYGVQAWATDGEVDINYNTVDFSATTCTDPNDADGDNYGLPDCDDCDPRHDTYHDQCCNLEEPYSGRIVYRSVTQATQKC